MTNLFSNIADTLKIHPGAKGPLVTIAYVGTGKQHQIIIPYYRVIDEFINIIILIDISNIIPNKFEHDTDPYFFDINGFTMDLQTN